jgi:hypothetical protein
MLLYDKLDTTNPVYYPSGCFAGGLFAASTHLYLYHADA